MKNILVLLIALLQINFAWSDCMSGGINAYPKSSAISSNSIIIVEGFGTAQKIIDSINNKYPVYLQSGQKKVKLKVKYTLKGNFNLTQVILIPEKPLEVGKTYELKIDENPHRLTRYNPSSGSFENITWTVKKPIKRPLLAFNSPPKHQKGSYEMFGCGPAAYTHFEIDISTKKEIFIKVDLFDITDSTTVTYCLPYENLKTLDVGHGMCSGAFNFTKNNQYKIRFKLFDFQGNKSAGNSEWIKFKSPVIY